jgi:hypothetical protein
MAAAVSWALAETSRRRLPKAVSEELVPAALHAATRVSLGFYYAMGVDIGAITIVVTRRCPGSVTEP